jgi:hypothetical protein
MGAMTTALPRYHLSLVPYEQPFKRFKPHVDRLLTVKRFHFASLHICAMRRLHGSGGVTQEGATRKPGVPRPVWTTLVESDYLLDSKLGYAIASIDQ